MKISSTASLSVLLACLFLVGCTVTPRQISGRLVHSASRAPVAGQLLALDRPPGDYEGIPIMFTPVPQSATLVTTTTDAKGRFTFVTSKDRGRILTIRLVGNFPPDFYGYAVTGIQDSLHPKAPQINYDTHIIHPPKGR